MQQVSTIPVQPPHSLPQDAPPPEALILVTGGAGFIGSALIKGLNDRGYTRIIVCDHWGQSSKFRNLCGLKFIDTLTPEALQKALDAPGSHNPLSAVHSIFHLGACSSTTNSDGDFLYHNNYRSTLALGHFAKAQGKRFVYASSAATYGNGDQGMEDNSTLDHLYSLRPLNLYAYSKHQADIVFAQKAYLDGFIGLKYFNVFGPNEYHKGDMRSFVAKAFDQIRASGQVQLFQSAHPDYAHGQQARDFVYIKDAIEATLHLWQMPFQGGAYTRGGLYNIGSGAASSFMSVVQSVFQALHTTAQVTFVPMPEHLKGKYQYHTQASIQKLAATGYRHRWPLGTAIEDYVQHYLLPQRYLADDLHTSALKPL
jgi:ADP-L-glycero-D-manno-heptose 6-epimerase